MELFRLLDGAACLVRDGDIVGAVHVKRRDVLWPPGCAPCGPAAASVIPPAGDLRSRPASSTGLAKPRAETSGD